MLFVSESGRRQRILDVRAAVLRRSERRRSFLCERRRSRWLLGAIRSERSEQSNRALSAVTRSVAIYTAASFHARLILQK
jgi:hypothetical protein